MIGEFVRKRIVQLAYQRGISERQLSKKIEKNPSYIATLNHEKRVPSLEALTRICEVLDVTLSEFFHSMGHQKNRQHNLAEKIQEKIDSEYMEKLYQVLKHLDKDMIQVQIQLLHSYMKHLELDREPE